MANYHRGRAKEWLCQKDLSALGISNLRASSSKGFADVVGVDNNAVYFIQLKRSKHRIVSIKAVLNAFWEDINKMKDVNPPEAAHTYVWLWTDGKDGGWRYFRIYKQKFIEINSFPDGDGVDICNIDTSEQQPRASESKSF